MSRKLEPSTRRWIVVTLAAIAIIAIVAEVIVLLSGSATSEALLTIAATAVGGIAGMAVPQGDGPAVLAVRDEAEPEAAAPVDQASEVGQVQKDVAPAVGPQAVTDGDDDL